MANQDEISNATETIRGHKLEKTETPEEKYDNDLDDLVKSMTCELEFYAELSARQSEPKPFIIHKLHPRVKSVDPISYHPTVVSIGPYHNGTKSLCGTESEKLKCLASVLQTTELIKIEKLLAALEKEEKMARNIYSEEISMDGNTFLKMMALDSSYILGHVFASSQRTVPNHKNLHTKLSKKKSSGGEETDLSIPLLDKETKEGELADIGTESFEPESFYRLWCTPHVVRDLFLLENQIPFFVIEKVYETMEGEFTASALREKTVMFVKKLIQPYLKFGAQDDIYNIKPTEFHHLLHLCHMYFKPLQNHKEFDYENFKGSKDFLRHLTRWRRATQYEEVGIRIKSKKFDESSPHSLLDVTFKNDVIEIPFLPIDGNTVSLFRNMVALEQMCPRYGNHFTSYVIFMSQIMCMPSDVTFLVQKGIITHNLASDEKVSNQFASLTRSVVFDFSGKYYLKSMSWEVEDRYKVLREKWQVRWIGRRFTNPWWTLVIYACLVYVICVVVRTYFVVMTYFSTR